MSGHICGDNRFELIEKYKQKLINSTNIETSKGEMAVIDSFLFRCWQMGWLDAAEKQIPQKVVLKEVEFHQKNKKYTECPNCGYNDLFTENFCPNCGQALDWSVEE